MTNFSKIIDFLNIYIKDGYIFYDSLDKADYVVSNEDIIEINNSLGIRLDNSAIGEHNGIKYVELKGKTGVFFDSIEDLWQQMHRSNTKIENYFLIKQKISPFFKNSLSIDELIDKYYSLLNTLDSVSDSSDNTFFTYFIPFDDVTKKIKLIKFISYNEFLELSGFDFNKIQEFMRIDNVHKSEKNNIFKSTLYDFLKNKNSDEISLRDFLTDFNALTEKLFQNYNIYINKFSFDKVRNEVESKSLSYIDTISKTVSEVQSKSLAMPGVIFVLAVFNKQLGKLSDDGLFHFIFSLSASYLFMFIALFATHIISELMLGVQIQTSRYLGVEIKKNEKEYLVKNISIRDEIKYIYEKLSRMQESAFIRINAVLWITRFIYAISILYFSGLLLGSLGIYLSIKFSEYVCIKSK